jgi:hypothetical protein
MKRSVQLCVCILPLLMVFVAGCGGSTGQVEGTLTIGGEAAPAGVEISFSPDSSEGTSGYAYTKEGGSYTLLMPGDSPEIPLGTYTVIIGSEVENEDGETIQELRIPAEYGEESTQKCDVVKGSQTYNIDVP